MKGWDELSRIYHYELETRRYSPVMLDSSGLSLARFRRWCSTLGIGWPQEVTAEHAQAWHEHLSWQPGEKGQLLSRNSIQHYLRLVRRFFRWAVKHNHLLFDPFYDVRIQHVDASERRRLLSVVEVELLLGAPDRETLRGQRDGAILETLYGTGLRREECCRLNLEDVDFGRGILRVAGKGKQWRLQPLGDHLVATLEAYVKSTWPLLDARGPDEALFLRLIGGRMRADAISAVVYRCGFAVGLGAIRAHLLRHAFATHLLQNGAKVEEVAQLLGHCNLESVETYTHVMPSMMTRAHRQTHPRARRQTPKKPPLIVEEDAQVVADMVSSEKKRRRYSC